MLTASSISDFSGMLYAVVPKAAALTLLGLTSAFSGHLRGELPTALTTMCMLLPLTCQAALRKQVFGKDRTCLSSALPLIEFSTLGDRRKSRGGGETAICLFSATYLHLCESMPSTLFCSSPCTCTHCSSADCSPLFSCHHYWTTVAELSFYGASTRTSA